MLFEYTEKDLKKFRKLAVFGDLHGDYQSFLSSLNVIDPTQDSIIFLGDYADRGPDGTNVIEHVNNLMKKYPKNVVALKGNHEEYNELGKPTFSPCDLFGEVAQKRGGVMLSPFRMNTEEGKKAHEKAIKIWRDYFKSELKPFIDKLYLAALIPGEILFVHGGISSKIKSLDDLKKPTKQIETDILWSYPYEGSKERAKSRDEGVKFGRDITEQVCEALDIKRIIRSHQPKKAYNGPYYEHDDRIVTTSSTDAYESRAFVTFLKPDKLSSISHEFV
jgi:calcineurin-like phosphoesterase family protein